MLRISSVACFFLFLNAFDYEEDKIQLENIKQRAGFVPRDRHIAHSFVRRVKPLLIIMKISKTRFVYIYNPICFNKLYLRGFLSKYNVIVSYPG